MTQRTIVQTLCDPHLLEDDKEVDGQEYRLGIQFPGVTRWDWIVVDLCPDHAALLVDPAQTLAAYGRTFQPPAGPGPQASVCGDCGRTFDTPRGLGAHRKRAHH
jgi:hypothetical protein